ncbi:MAG: prolyl-tRNA synthetase associated domain-containing protein [Clostridiales bacterium]|nr:prolyl-tRNA synthetase associated domain-containing protein [Clostridiales bacterium]
MNQGARKVLDLLDQLSIRYELAQHEKVSSIEECALVEQMMNARMPKNLLLTTTGSTRYALLVMDGRKQFITSIVSKNAGYSRLSFADDSAVERLLSTYPGAISPFGLMFDADCKVECLFDRELLKEEQLLFHPLDNTCSVKLSTADLLDRFLPSVNHPARPVNTQTRE